MISKLTQFNGLMLFMLNRFKGFHVDLWGVNEWISLRLSIRENYNQFPAPLPMYAQHLREQFLLWLSLFKLYRQNHIFTQNISGYMALGTIIFSWFLKRTAKKISHASVPSLFLKLIQVGCLMIEQKRKRTVLFYFMKFTVFYLQ
jgi:hypothetical protein